MKPRAKRSKFVSLLLKRFIIIETFALLIIMIVYFSITIPWAINNKLSTNESTAEIVTKLLDNSLTNAVNIASNTGNTRQLADYLKAYISTNDNQYRAQIELSLNNSAYTSNARAIAIDIPDYGRITSITNFYKEDTSYFNTEAYQRVLEKESLSTFSEIYNIEADDDYDATIPDETIAYSRNFNRNNINYTITVFYDMADTLNMINSIYDKSFDSYIIFNTNNSVIYTLDNESYIKLAHEFIESHNKIQTNTFAYDGYFTVNFQDVRSWKFVGYISLISIIRGLLTDQLGSFIVVIMTLFLTFYVFIAPSLSRAMRPVSTLTNAMAEFGAGNLNIKADKIHDDEIGKMIDVFNSMTTQINTYIDDIKAYQEDQEKSHYSFLISQIDPHFLCNSMNMVSALIRKNCSQNALELNKALIEVIRDRLRIRNTEVLDTVAQEVNVVNQYLKITSFMYQNCVEIIWNVCNKLKKAKIPKNIMQPIVENSLLHGLFDKDTGEIRGKITIDIFEQNSNCIIVIADNGTGMSQKELIRFNTDEQEISSEQEKGKHIALRNIKNRLRYITNGQDCIFITSAPGQGTTVKFIFPLITEGGDS